MSFLTNYIFFQEWICATWWFEPFIFQSLIDQALLIVLNIQGLHHQFQKKVFYQNNLKNVNLSFHSHISGHKVCSKIMFFIFHLYIKLARQEVRQLEKIYIWFVFGWFVCIWYTSKWLNRLGPIFFKVSHTKKFRLLKSI